MAEVVELLDIADGVGEVAKVLLHEVACLEVFLRIAIIDVVVPIETSLAFSLDEAHHALFHVVQDIEASKDDGSLALQEFLYHAIVSLHLLDDMTIECTFPKFAFSKKPLVQKCVNLEHVFPCFQELLL